MGATSMMGNREVFDVLYSMIVFPQLPVWLCRGRASRKLLDTEAQPIGFQRSLLCAEEWPLPKPLLYSQYSHSISGSMCCGFSTLIAHSVYLLQGAGVFCMCVVIFFPLSNHNIPILWTSGPHKNEWIKPTDEAEVFGMGCLLCNQESNICSQERPPCPLRNWAQPSGWLEAFYKLIGLEPVSTFGPSPVLKTSGVKIGLANSLSNRKFWPWSKWWKQAGGWTNATVRSTTHMGIPMGSFIAGFYWWMWILSVHTNVHQPNVPAYRFH